MKRLILSILAVFAIAAAVVGCGTSNPAVKPLPSNTDLQQLQGTWIGGGVKVTISGNNFNMTTIDATEGYGSGTFTLDPTANPKTIDLYFVSHPSPEFVGKTGLGLYMLNGTTLTLADSTPGGVRPTSFDKAAVLIKQ